MQAFASQSKLTETFVRRARRHQCLGNIDERLAPAFYWIF